MKAHDQLCFLDARRLAELLRARELSAVEVMSAILARIERLNPAVNAIPTLRPREELLADGTDLGGSLRNPASFCNVVGFRPSPGRVPRLNSHDDTLGVHGPMARNVADLAMLLAVIAGPDPRDPLSLSEPGAALAPPLGR